MNLIEEGFKMKCLFCDFLSGKKKKHENGLPFKILHEEKHSISFLSIDVPKKTRTKVLVIPKKHFEFFEDVPSEINIDLIKHVQRISDIIRKKYGGSNIVLNNGKDANQYIPHVHFHIIARTYNDKLFDGFVNQIVRDLSLDEFNKIHKDLKKNLDE